MRLRQPCARCGIMTDPSRETARVQYLLTMLGLLLILTLVLLLGLAVYPYVFAPPDALATAQARSVQPTRSLTPSPVPSHTPSPTRTLRDTFTPTISLTPTRTLTPTLTPTLPGPPTLTPARPVGGEAYYKLHDWTPERADYMVALIEDYPNTLPRQSRGANDENYYAAFEFAVIAQREALLRFPDTPQAEAWRWRLAYSLARLGDPQAGDLYASLIEQGLNREQASVDGLREWIQENEPRLDIAITGVPPIPGYLSSYLIEVRGGGSAFILLRETPSAYQTVALTSDFDFIGLPRYRALTGDLTADEVSEIAIIRQPVAGEYLLQVPRVFDLAQEPPLELPFHPGSSNFNIGTDYESQWEIVATSQGEAGLKFTGRLFPSCPVTLTLLFTWDGAWLEAEEPEFTVEPAMGTLSYCRFVVEHASNVWGPEATTSLMETILPLWPPESDENGDPFPADEGDFWRYRMGVNHALAGDRERALANFDEVILQPAAPSSRWVAPAEQFLAYYRLENGLYRACAASEHCQPAVALQRMVEAAPPGEYPNILATLWQGGVSQRSSGYFDFDGDGRAESWLTVRHRPGERLELWVLILYRDGIKAFNFGGTDSTLPQITYYDDSTLPPVVLIHGVQAFQVNRLPDTLEPYLTNVELPKTFPDRFKDALEAQLEALFAGENPANVTKTLLSLQEYPGLICRGTWSCDRYYYILGLSAELAGEKSTASSAYLRLWLDYSRSPYTTMARLKLVSAFATPTPTISLTPTSTIAQASTPTVSGTPPTSTTTPPLSGTTTAYPGPSPFPTFTPYP